MHEPDTRPVIYIAGPYTNPDPVENTHNTVKFASHLWTSGLAYPLVPHLSMLWHAIAPRPVEDWYEIDLAHMQRCDGVIRLPGDSTGADAEVAYAVGLGIPVLESPYAVWASTYHHGRIREWIRAEVQPSRSEWRHY